MTWNFRGKNPKDIETAQESIISSTSFTRELPGLGSSITTLKATNQQVSSDSFDNFIESRK